ncbi:LacI family DNA-binding transcriptional regulator [Chelativorans intermedius]|uniref:LacI family DNA-binding transcriptional regulator n=1 Tax=Chelativorans intermedius TaxID=515947 RepID=A0ABV6D5F2_9HYPH|nr:LacI family DNA-binding transcriptional regulator [Chelativorans intermedius]MCT8998795.1 LacI family DNA-binding transcriptional regulator [Chelativorans intermedius]
MSGQEKPGRKPTSFDVARRAGVSRAAVSRTFTPNASVSPETREKVVKAAKELGYRVNYLARGLINRRSDFVGVVAAGMDNPFRAMQIEQITKKLVRRNFRPILLPADHGESADHVMDQLLHYNVSGVLVTSDAPPTALCAEFAAAGVPIVLINKADAIPAVDRVVCDTDTAGRLAATTLLEAGARHLAVVSASAISYTARRRQQAFLACCHALEADVRVIPVAVNDYANGLAAAERLDGVDGVFCVNDYMACGLIDGLRRRGVAVPHSVRVIGHDDVPQAAWGSYELTTMRQPCDLQADQAIDLLTSRMAEPEMAERVELTPVTLVRRATA